MNELGRFIKYHREAQKISQKKLGNACRVSDSEIHKIESGVRQNPNWNILCEIARVLGLHPFEILLEAGYITEQDIHPDTRLRGLENLSFEEITTVQLFIDFLVSRNSVQNDIQKEE